MRGFLFVLVALVACDPVVDKHTPDAPPGIDGAPDAPTHGMVSVKVYDPNNTQAVVVGVPVVFIEADGTLVGHPTTGSDGIAMADVHTNATATVVITTQGSTQMQTVTGLVPGDTIVLGPNTPPSTLDGNFTITFPSYPGAASYRGYGPCGSSSSAASPQTLTMYTDCKQTTMDLQVIAFDGNSNPIAYLDKPNVAYTANGSAAITGSYAGMSTFTASYTNINPVVTSLNMTRAVPDGYGYGGGGGGVPANGTLSATALGPQGTNATITTRAINGRMTNIFIQQIAGNALTYGLDVGGSLLPWIGQPTFDIPTYKLSVPIDTTGTTTDAPDLFYADVSYSRSVNGTTSDFAWLVFGPTPGDVTLPALPAEVGDVMPKMGDTVGSPFAVIFETDTLNGYDAVRPDIYGAVNNVVDAPHPSAMRIRESTYGGGT